MNRPLIELSRKELTPMIAAGDPVAIAEGLARNESRKRRGKSPLAAYGVAAPAPAPTPAPARSMEEIIADEVAKGIAKILASHGAAAPAPAPAPEPDHTDDVAVWDDVYAGSDSRWEAYATLRTMGWNSRRIARSAGVTPGTVLNSWNNPAKGVKPPKDVRKAITGK